MAQQQQAAQGKVNSNNTATTPPPVEATAAVKDAAPVLPAPVEANPPVAEPSTVSLTPVPLSTGKENGSGEFNAGQFLASVGMKLLDSTDKPNVVRVLSADGQEGTMDLNAVMHDAGIKDARVKFNDPSTAIARSPIDLVDRLKLSFGNTRGQIDYLQKAYPGSKVMDEDGNLKIQKNGVWYDVDPTLLGDGDGWSLAGHAKELLADAADIAGDAVVAVGQAVGTAAGAAAGTLAAPGAGTLAGGVAGAGAGGAAGSAAKAVLGRFLGTYNATPEELTSQIALDGVLSLAGQAIPLGAKKLILPYSQQAFRSIGEWASPTVKNMIAAVAQKASGATEVGAFALAKDAPGVMGLVDAGIASAGKGATSDVIAQSMEKQAANTLKPLVIGAQERASSAYVADQAKVIASVADDFVHEIATPVRETITGLVDMGLITNVETGRAGQAAARFIPKDAEAIAKTLGIPSTGVAGSLGAKVAKIANSVQVMLGEDGQQLVGKEGAQKSLQLVRDLRSLHGEIKINNPQAAALMDNMMEKLAFQVRNSLPESAQRLAASMDSNYAARVPFVEMAEKAASKAGGRGIEEMINEMKRGPSGQMRTMLTTLSEMHPQGEAILKTAQNAIGAVDFVNWLPQGSLGESLARGGAAVGATSLLGIPGAVGSAVASSPRAFGRAVSTSSKIAASASQATKLLSETARKSALNNDEFIAQMLGATLRQDPK